MQIYKKLITSLTMFLDCTFGLMETSLIQSKRSLEEILNNIFVTSNNASFILMGITCCFTLLISLSAFYWKFKFITKACN